MTQEAIAQRLREADEDDVAAALEGSYVEEIGAVGHDKLVEFFQRMLDRLIGPAED